jgi:hypothetical protein
MIWHPTKWWYQYIKGSFYGWPGKGIPPGLLDSGLYWYHEDENGNIIPDAPDYYKCLTCCCATAKCDLPQEILMTISGFSGTLSSVDRPADYGYSPSNACDCPILFHGSLGPDQAIAGEYSWTGYSEACCKCRASEKNYWWPRYLVGEFADGSDMCERSRPICTYFPYLCASVPQPVKTPGRIAARYIDPCPSPCTYFIWSDYDYVPDYSLVELTDCAQAPNADARADYNCLLQQGYDVVRNFDSYLPPPGFRGTGAVNLLPLCDGKFWNDTTYYRMCVEGGFWCQNPTFNDACYCEGNFYGSEDFFTGLHEVRNDAWKTSDWCRDSPTRCQGPVPVGKVKWDYYRPKTVLISQPSFPQCAPCPAYGFGYGSSFSNYGQGSNWYDPNDDGHCIGKTNVAMEDFNQTFTMRNEIRDAAPDFEVIVGRARTKPPTEATLINAQLLYSVKKVVRAPPPCDCVLYNQGFWNIDYPCEPVVYDGITCKCHICSLAPGLVAPKLRAFYQGETGSGADVYFALKNYCPVAGLTGMGALFSGSYWYVDTVWIGDSKGADYAVGDTFVFSFYENPFRGGEGFAAAKEGGLQTAEVTDVSADGEILGIKLVRADEVAEKLELCAFDLDTGDPLVPLYYRVLSHRYAVGIPGNGYVEGDVLTFEPKSGLPNGSVETGGRYYPYLKTAMTAREKAQATVLEVDSRGGIVDWYMCGAENHIYSTPEELNCGNIATGRYTDVRYQNRCEYVYRGYIPVRYSWSGIMDYHFYSSTYCEHAWAEFSFSIDQISVKNTITVKPPTQPDGKRAVLRIANVSPNMQYSGVTVEPLRYQNYELSPGPSSNTSGYGWYKNHEIPVPQGVVTQIEVLEPGSGYVTKIPATNPGDPDQWEPVTVSTSDGISIRGVTDDIRAFMAGYYGWETFCECEANIDTNPHSPTFGGILSVSITKGGFWYFAHEYDHIWFAKAGSNWFFELANPIADGQAVPQYTPDCDGRFQWSAGANGTGPCDCYHASRDNWGELHHYDGFYEPYPSGYHEYKTFLPGYGPYTYYSCAVNTGAPNYAWPVNNQYITGNPGYTPAGNSANRWSTKFCPTNLLERPYRMILIHPCAACAKELNLAGSQTCWNMGGYGDTTYYVYPDTWHGTGTAMITKLGGSSLVMTTSIPNAD